MQLYHLFAQLYSHTSGFIIPVLSQDVINMRANLEYVSNKLEVRQHCSGCDSSLIIWLMHTHIP